MIPKTDEEIVVYDENNNNNQAHANSPKRQKLDLVLLPNILKEYEDQISEEEEEPKPIFNCDLCKRDYLSKKLLKEHNKRRHEFPCKVCKIKFITKDQKRDHDADVHPPQKSSAILNELKISAQKSRLAKATLLKLDLNNSDRYFNCSMCMKKFATELRLKDHKSSYHGLFKEEEIYYLCPKDGCQQGIEWPDLDIIITPDYLQILPDLEQNY